MDILECKNICHKNYRGKVREVIDSQIEKFFEIENSDFKPPSHTYKVGDTVTLNTHHYLHGTGQNENAIEFVSKYGIVIRK